MTDEKFVVRILDDSDRLLSWATVYASPRPQERGASCPFWPKSNTRFLVEADGLATKFSVHWCELDVARVERLMEATEVRAGQVFTFAWLQPVWLVPGMRGVPLPGVTVREDITMTPPTGNLAAAGTTIN